MKPWWSKKSQLRGWVIVILLFSICYTAYGVWRAVMVAWGAPAVAELAVWVAVGAFVWGILVLGRLVGFGDDDPQDSN